MVDRNKDKLKSGFEIISRVNVYTYSNKYHIIIAKYKNSGNLLRIFFKINMCSKLEIFHSFTKKLV